MLENTDRALAEVIDKLNTMVSPEAMEAVIRAVRIDCLSDAIVFPLIAVIGWAALVAGLRCGIPEWSKSAADENVPRGVFFLALTTIGILMALIGTTVLLVHGLWPYLCLGDPQAKFAHDILRSMSK